MKLAYRKLGNGPALVILHGLYGCSDNWLSVGKYFAERYTVYLVDLRNHGKSPHSNIHSYESMSNDIAEFFTEHKLNDTVLLGHSMGGKVAIEYARKNPRFIKALIIVDISPFIDKNNSKNIKVHTQILNALLSLNIDSITSRKEADEELSNYISEKNLKLFLLKNIERKDDKSFKWKINLPILKDSIENIMSGISLETIFSTPTLFIKGELSDYISTQSEELITEWFSNTEIKTINNAAHWVHAQQFSAFVKSIDSYLQKHKDNNHYA